MHEMRSSQRLPRIIRSWGRMSNFVISKRISGFKRQVISKFNMMLFKNINRLMKFYICIMCITIFALYKIVFGSFLRSLCCIFGETFNFLQWRI